MGEGVLEITEEAKAVALEARAEEPDPERLALWVEVSGAANGAYTYDIYFQDLAQARDDDVVSYVGELPVVVPAASVDRLRGARLEWSDADGGGLVMRNPNAPPAPPPPPGADQLDSELARRVARVLDEEVNPMIALHGGHATLVGLEGTVAYLELSGGCQGCGLARVTLSQGIEVAIRDAVPEITEVVDVTDHAAGTDPFFQPAKK
jgi:Fe/S biogenesis protein NfuA